MRTREQVDRLAKAYLDGQTKTQAMIAGGYSPRSASSNTNKVLPRENQRHYLFAQGLFIHNWNMAQAARFAGYSPRWAGTNTARLVRHPDVQAEILRIRQRLFPADFPPDRTDKIEDSQSAYDKELRVLTNFIAKVKAQAAWPVGDT